MIPTSPSSRPGRRSPLLRTGSRLAAAALALGLLAGCTDAPSPAPAPEPSAATLAPSAGAPSGSEPTTPGATPAPAPPTTAAPEAPSPPPAPASPAATALADLPVAAAGTMSDYDREGDFGGWADPDGNGCDARNDVLARDLTDVVTEDGCTVRSGTLEDPYTGTVIEFRRGVLTSSDVQIDHVVSLGNAWVSGARRLSQDQRVALANDPLNLLAVDGPTNGVKSDKHAGQWLPPNEAFRCEFVALQIAVKTRYGLWVTAPEKQAMADVLADCPGRPLPGAAPVPGQAPAEEPAPEAAPAPAPAPAEEVHYPSCAAVREAGASPLHAGEPGYRAGLDGDRDGVACE
ncbi:DUF1524 domain-containing protein [Kocuria sp. LUK]|uniref:GmrSD restriction endonuclease domain-containing protein n=1 Tax=Kocuria sp. LUK TaxID=2897828 RepID=UPI001E63245D|nr:DUF1524 domain-containing protein [Kocuria sp. LUK]MCD1144533.1 DUF1524 domain-containing protein [Kocuria sp. LUK]